MWTVRHFVDNDGHLNIYVESDDGSDIIEIPTGQGDGEDGEQFALRFTTESIEKNNIE